MSRVKTPITFAIGVVLTVTGMWGVISSAYPSVFVPVVIGICLVLAHIFGFPLFWGLFSIFGGICTIYHGFCRCVCGGTHPSVLTNVERSN